MTFRSRVEVSGVSDDVVFWLVRTRHDGTRHMARLTWEQYEPGMETEPTLRPFGQEGQNTDMLQAVVDAAYEAGIRPRQADNKGETAALKNHIADLRHVAFAMLQNGSGSSGQEMDRA